MTDAVYDELQRRHAGLHPLCKVAMADGDVVVQHPERLDLLRICHVCARHGAMVTVPPSTRRVASVLVSPVRVDMQPGVPEPPAAMCQALSARYAALTEREARVAVYAATVLGAASIDRVCVPPYQANENEFAVHVGVDDAIAYHRLRHLAAQRLVLGLWLTASAQVVVKIMRESRLCDSAFTRVNATAKRRSASGDDDPDAKRPRHE
jgi:hypothetical protein